MSIPKEWAAIKNDAVIAKRESKRELERAPELMGESGYDIVALPKPYKSIIV